MFLIDNVLVEESVADVAFACDLAACKGACCTMPGSRGAPLLDEETEQIRRWYPEVKDLLPARHVAVIERDGLFAGTPGDFVTTCVDDRACVFVYTENGIAFCAFERAYREGRIPWRKPISCHLFPIRVRRHERDFLQYESIQECLPALRRGAEERIALDTFLRDALTRAYGPLWVERLRAACERYRMSGTRTDRP